MSDVDPEKVRAAIVERKTEAATSDAIAAAFRESAEQYKREAWRIRVQIAELRALLRDETKPMEEITHMCPPHGSSIVPCCGRMLLELQPVDRISLDKTQVTCHGAEEVTS